MTAFTINGGATTEWDSLTGGSVNATLDTYALSNGTTLRIATDTHWCAGHSTAAGSLDTVTFTGTGGRVLVDPSAVRVVDYTGGSGTVPAIGTSITQGGVTGILLGVWSGWQAEPTAVAAAMPATGYIKFKSVTGGAFVSGALTGITATASGASRQGWIEIRGADTASITVPRIGKFQVIGPSTDPTIWFELGTTTGVRGQILPCPTTGTVAGVWPGVWIETSAGSGVYERYAGCGSMAALATNPTDERGKIIWQTTAGIRIGSDGTNNVGYLPPTGCKVRIPAAIFTCVTRTAAGSGARVLPSATLTTRQEFITTSAGDIDIDGAVFQWYGNFLQPYRARVVNSAFSDTLIQQEIASTVDVDNVIVGPTQAQLNLALNMLSCFGGGSVQNCLFARFSLAAASAYVNYANYNKNINFNSVKSLTLLNRGNATTGVWGAIQNISCTWVNCMDIGARMYQIGAQKIDISSHHYADNFSGTTGTANPHSAVEFINGVTDSIVGSVDFMGLTNVQPYTAVVQVGGSYNNTFRNIGVDGAPLNLGTVNATGVIINSTGNSDGIRLQRCYVSNTRTGPYAFTNSDNNVEFQDIFPDYADTSAMTALNTTMKGCGFTGATTGQTSVYGTHWSDNFTSATVGKVQILCNEPTVASAPQCAITSGVPQFNSVGQLSMTIVGQQVTWEMPYFAKGHTALANLAPTLTGTNTANLTYEFQCDKGTGYGGTWLTLNAANLTAQGAIDPAIGFKLKVRATCATANAGNLLTNIAIPTVTTSVAQSGNPHPLDTTTVTFTGLQTGTDVVVLTAGTTTILAQTDENPTSNYGYTYTGTPTVDVGFIKAGFVPLYLRNLALGSVDTSIPVAMTADRNYL